MGWTREQWNIGYPSLATPTPFKSQSAGFKFILIKRRLTTSHIPTLDPVLKPALPTYTIYSNSPPPFHLWHFTDLPRASRVSAINVFLVFTMIFVDKSQHLWNKPGFATEFRTRQGLKGVGVGAYIKNNIKYKGPLDKEKFHPEIRLFTIPYFSVRSWRSSALHYGQPFWMSVKTT